MTCAIRFDLHAFSVFFMEQNVQIYIDMYIQLVKDTIFIVCMLLQLSRGTVFTTRMHVRPAKTRIIIKLFLFYESLKQQTVF